MIIVFSQRLIQLLFNLCAYVPLHLNAFLKI
jgi:hypothetical protein